MPHLLGLPVPPQAQDIILSVLARAGVDSAAVSSVGRTPKHQAEVMFDNLIAHGHNQGVVAQHNLYLPAGDVVIDVYVANKLLPKDQIIELMRQKIVEVGPEKVSHHCCDPALMTVVDLEPDSIPKDKHAAFEAAVKAEPRISKFLSPLTSDPAYHLEIPVVAPVPPIPS